MSLVSNILSDKVKIMYDELMDEFLPWFLFMEGNEFTCPECNGIISKGRKRGQA